MPVAYVDIPAGVNDGAKKKIFQELYEEIHEAWPIPDTRVLIREWPNEAVSQDGRIENVPMRPICTLAVPPGLEHDAKQRLVRQISNTIGEACGREVEEIHLPSGTKIYNNWVLTFFWELPLDKVALGDLIATENPLVLENLPPQLRCGTSGNAAGGCSRPVLNAGLVFLHAQGDEAIRSSDPHGVAGAAVPRHRGTGRGFTCRAVSDSAGPLVTPHSVPAPSARRHHSPCNRYGGTRSVNMGHDLAADAAVQQGVDRRLRLAP